jgi:hypothetical protein
MLTLGGILEKQSNGGMVYTTSALPEPGRDTGYMVQPQGGMLEVDKGSHQLIIGFWSFRMVVPSF